MFRITHYLQELRSPTPLTPRRAPPGPVVIWNLIRRCNLTCRHCYSISADIDFDGELSTREAYAVLDDLHGAHVPALILSGGEPLLREDLFDIARRAKALGFYLALSTNGTLIDAPMMDRIEGIGFDYVGISLDGLRATHDDFRRKQGAFDAALAGVRRCRDRGVKVGVRFTLTQGNAQDLDPLLDLIAAEGVDKFYLSHLNYAGRGNVNRKRDALLATSRAAVRKLFDRCWDHLERGEPVEFVSGNNDADAVLLLQWAAERFPERVDHLRAKLVQWGGNASGINVANIDNLGNVHPDTYWWDHHLGNVRQQPFSAIWRDTDDALMQGLRASPRPLKGRCGQCAYRDVCNGNTRVRALRLTGDAWEEDPACYLEDEEIGVTGSRPRLTAIPINLSRVN